MGGETASAREEEESVAALGVLGAAAAAAVNSKVRWGPEKTGTRCGGCDGFVKLPGTRCGGVGKRRFCPTSNEILCP